MLSSLLLLLLPAVSTGPAASTGSVTDAGPGEDERPDLVLFLLDDVGVGDVHPHVPTPRLVELARRGTTFERFYAQTACSPSRAALLTGLQPHRAGNGIGGNVLGIAPADERNRGLAPGTRTVASELGEAGYSTALFGKWHLGTLSEDAPFAPLSFGFQHYDGHPGNFVAPDGFRSWSRTRGDTVVHETGYATTVEVDAFLAWWAATPPPRFALVAFHAAHATHGKDSKTFEAPPPELLPPGLEVGPGERGRFEAAVTALDHELGRALDALDLAHTLVLVLGDNGTPGPVRPPALPPHARMKGSLVPGGVHVPCVACGPGVRAGATTGSLAQITDVRATLLDAAGLPAPGGDGLSLLPVLADPGASVRSVGVLVRFAPNGPPPWDELSEAAFDARHWLLREGDREELYDLERDPWCLHALPVRGPELRRAAQRLGQTLDEQGP